MRIHLGRVDGVSVGRHCVGGWGGQAGICYMRHYPSPQTPLRDMGRGGQCIQLHTGSSSSFEEPTIVNCHGPIFQFLG